MNTQQSIHTIKTAHHSFGSGLFTRTIIKSLNTKKTKL